MLDSPKHVAKDDRVSSQQLPLTRHALHFAVLVRFVVQHTLPFVRLSVYLVLSLSVLSCPVPPFCLRLLFRFVCLLEAENDAGLQS